MAMPEEETNPNCVEEEEEKKEKGKCKEGYNLLGYPTFKELENGRFKCVENGHEMLTKDMESYSNSKRCRLGLIESYLAQKKPPLNMFKQDPLNKSKLICKLTGVTVNKSEEHIWKHINGKKFLNKLEQKETEKLMSNGMILEEDEEEPRKESKQKANGVKKDRKKGVKKDIWSERIPVEDKGAVEDKSDSEEPEFWIPPVGSRWDFDDGKDRWGSSTESGEESNDGDEIDADEKSGAESAELANEKTGAESAELSMRTKRMSIEIGPSSFASRKKKSKTNSSNPSTS
ncbi:Surfeit locus 2 [Macleaya cordata]|uniref:Surfeit locus 2 n=1 Tax=Macleaya cordata TaxID=56857 RepID=A0A200RDM8_MACCD|nr:Surfeit locus 2 [Macleaya cordata]